MRVAGVVNYVVASATQCFLHIEVRGPFRQKQIAGETPLPQRTGKLLCLFSSARQVSSRVCNEQERRPFAPDGSPSRRRASRHEAPADRVTDTDEVFAVVEQFPRDRRIVGGNDEGSIPGAHEILNRAWEEEAEHEPARRREALRLDMTCATVSTNDTFQGLQHIAAIVGRNGDGAGQDGSCFSRRLQADGVGAAGPQNKENGWTHDFGHSGAEQAGAPGGWVGGQSIHQDRPASKCYELMFGSESTSSPTPAPAQTRTDR
ncbi:MAG: hypothetical protein MAG451_00342 [Anaerolineales bacterium]|nr:hypothetical protein [Anaerolineales bacterium]